MTKPSAPHSAAPQSAAPRHAEAAARGANARPRSIPAPAAKATAGFDAVLAQAQRDVKPSIREAPAADPGSEKTTFPKSPVSETDMPLWPPLEALSGTILGGAQMPAADDDDSAVVVAETKAFQPTSDAPKMPSFFPQEGLAQTENTIDRSQAATLDLFQRKSLTAAIQTKPPSPSYATPDKAAPSLQPQVFLNSLAVETHAPAASKPVIFADTAFVLAGASKGGGEAGQHHAETGKPQSMSSTEADGALAAVPDEGRVDLAFRALRHNVDGQSAEIRRANAALGSSPETPRARIEQSSPPSASTGATPSITMQMAPRLLSEAAQMIGQTPAISANAPLTTEPPPNPLRVLKIQLEPAHLGVVTVRLSLSGSALRVQVDAEQAATAHALRRDSGALSALLASAGCAVDSLSVHVMAAEPAGGASPGFTPDGFQARSDMAISQSDLSFHGEDRRNGPHSHLDHPSSHKDDQNDPRPRYPGDASQPPSQQPAPPASRLPPVSRRSDYV